MSKFKIGTDPEVILLLDEKPFSAEGVVGGDKYEPRQLKGEVKVHEDNILVEYNTKPASNKIEFIREIVSSIYSIHHELLKDKGIKISKACFADFDDKYLQTMQAQTIGCTPEFDAFTLEMIEPPTLETFTGRSAGGHIHVGYENENEFESMMIIKMLDLHLGVPSLIVDTDVRRRQLYGKASSYRRSEGIKVEYRTLSNFWTFNTGLITWVYDTVAKVVEDVLKGVILDDEVYLQAREAINTNNSKLAQQLIETYKLVVPVADGEDILDAIYADDVFLSEFVNNIPGETVSFETSENESQFEIMERRNDGVVVKKGVPLDVHEDSPGFEMPGKKRSMRAPKLNVQDWGHLTGSGQTETYQARDRYKTESPFYEDIPNVVPVENEEADDTTDERIARKSSMIDEAVRKVKESITTEELDSTMKSVEVESQSLSSYQVYMSAKKSGS
jgi:hypothetical protein